jgi:hypothetical protein
MTSNNSAGMFNITMIRRHVGSEWWLVQQHDHALLAGELARHLGGSIDALSDEAIEGIGLHDCGWPETHDQRPTLNDRGQPTDVFEISLELGLRIWRESSKRAWQSAGDYQGLLVSLHSLSLSAHAASRTLSGPRPSAPPELKAQFDLNKFQHAEIEQQESCRKRLGMRTDLPLTLGLAADSLDPAEQQLAFDFRWLQAMDQLSLDLCCTHPPFGSIAHVSATRRGNAPLHLTVSRTGPSSACVSPWPFASPRLVVSVPFRRLLAQPMMSQERFVAAYNSAAAETMTLTLDPPGPLAAIA